MYILNESKSEGYEVIKRETEYLEYITEHRNNVKEAFKNLFLSTYDFIETASITNEEFRNAIDEIRTEIELHDSSKLDDLEFYGYRVKYYPTKQEEYNMNNDPVYADEVHNKSDEAWLHHLMVNDHHPKHWKVIDGQYKDDNKPTDMTLGAIIHMICDWQAMAYYFKNNMFEWYSNADEEKNDLSDNTRNLVNEILDYLTPIIF